MSILWYNGTALSFKDGIFCCCKQRRRNQQRNKQKTRKFVSDIKKLKNVNVLKKRTKINALEFLSAYSSNERDCNTVFRFFR